jgi:ATP-dependent Clp protease protease subunit
MPRHKEPTIPFRDLVEYRMADQRLIDIYGMVDSAMAYEVGMRLRYLDSVSSKPIRMYLNTPGGHIHDGLAIFDVIKSLKAPVNIIGSGQVMSMGAVIIQAAAKRQALPHTHFMLHELQTFGRGQESLSSMRDSQKYAEKLQAVLNTILAERTGHDIKKLAKMVERRDYYIDVKQALELNLIDEVVER